MLFTIILQPKSHLKHNQQNNHVYEVFSKYFNKYNQMEDLTEKLIVIVIIPILLT